MFYQEKGFTLIEVLVVLAIIGLVMTAIYSLHLTGWKVWNFNQHKMTNHQAGMIIMSRILRGIRAANDVVIKNNGKDLRLEISNDTGRDYVRYVVDNNYLYYSKQKATEWPSNWNLNQRITDVIINNFNCVMKEDNNKIIITINLSLGTSKEKYSLQNQAYLRN